MPAGVKLIVGLGNPGPEYEKTRHNVGAWLVDRLAEHYQLTLKFETKFHGRASKLNLEGESVWLFQPTTFMNESGRALAAIVRFYKIPTSTILVAHDELDFPPGTIRIKSGGGHGGHNGLRDIISAVGGRDFLRLRIGIGHPGHKDRVTPYVLGAPSKSDQQNIMEAIDEGIAVIPQLVAGEIQPAFHKLHSD